MLMSQICGSVSIIIGFFVWEYPPKLVGGFCTYTEYITHEFRDLGHDVIVLTLNPRNLKTREMLKGVEIHHLIIVDASNVFALFVTDDLRKWGTNICFFMDFFIYNILSATKFINGLIKKEGYKFDVVCVHDWLSSISGIIVKNETKIPVMRTRAGVDFREQVIPSGPDQNGVYVNGDNPADIAWDVKELLDARVFCSQIFPEENLSWNV